MRRMLRELITGTSHNPLSPLSPLAAVDVMGEGTKLYGAPFVDNQGRIEIGQGFHMSAVPIRSHLATGPGGVLRIGDRVRVAHGAAITAHSEVVIGDDVDVGPFVMILDADFHGTKDRSAAEVAKPIHIGRGVKLGAGVVVLRGATIGDGAVIAPHSVVARVIPPGAHFAGAPARPDPHDSEAGRHVLS